MYRPAFASLTKLHKLQTRLDRLLILCRVVVNPSTLCTLEFDEIIL